MLYNKLCTDCINLSPESRPPLELVKQRFTEPEFLNSLYGEVDDFWKTTFIGEFGRQVPWETFWQAFVEKNGNKNYSKEVLEDNKSVPNMGMKYLKHMLQVGSDNMVTRESYSSYCSLMKEVDGYKAKNSDKIFKFLIDLYTSLPVWFGFMNEQEALEKITNIDTTVGSSIICYSPVFERGRVSVYLKVVARTFGKKLPTVEIMKYEAQPISALQFPVIIETVNEIIKKVRSNYNNKIEFKLDSLLHHPGYYLTLDISDTVTHYTSTYVHKKE